MTFYCKCKKLDVESVFPLTTKCFFFNFPHGIATFCLKTGLKLGLESRLKSLVETRDFVKVSSRRDSRLVEKSIYNVQKTFSDIMACQKCEKRLQLGQICF